MGNCCKTEVLKDIQPDILDNKQELNVNFDVNKEKDE